jgi:hypothetical protein
MAISKKKLQKKSLNPNRSNRIRLSKYEKKALIRQQGGYKKPEQIHLKELKQFILGNALEFKKQYREFLSRNRIMSAYLNILDGISAAASLHNNIKVFMNIELIKEICNRIRSMFEITEHEFNSHRFKFLHRILTKVDDDYLKNCSVKEKEERSEKLAKYLNELNNFINTEIFNKSVEDKQYDIMKVDNLRGFQYEILNVSDIIDSSKARASARISSRISSRRSNTNA